MALRKLLSEAGFKFEEQKQFDRCTVDAWVPSHGLIFEADGRVWHAFNEAKNPGYHYRRDKFLLSYSKVRDVIHLTDDKEILIPVSIFIKRLSVLETVTKYLKEELNLSYHQIGVLLNRDERNIWHTYKNANKKHTPKLKVTFSKYFIPISIFQNKLSVLENIVLYLKDELSLSYHAIAVLLERNDRTIWTMYQRARKKTKNL